MLYLAIFFALMCAFWGYVSFRDARWKADGEGPSVWDYAFPGIVTCALCGLAAAGAFITWMVR